MSAMRTLTVPSESPIVIDGTFAAVTGFLHALGFEIRIDARADGFLKGVEIANGVLLVERAGDDLAGELLHEAGHLAVLPSQFRTHANGDLSGVVELMSCWIDEQGAAIDPESPVVRTILQSGECEANAWSFAAASALRIDTRIPFYRGFEGEGLALHDQVASGFYFGVHGLAAGGMTDLPRPRSISPFPVLKRWLQI